MSDYFTQNLQPATGPENSEQFFAEEPSTTYKAFAFIWEILKIIIIALAIIIPVRYLLVQPFSVHGASMETMFYNGDYVLINEFSYKFVSEPERGDVIVFRYPNQPSEFFIKRIIGLPGETVEIRNSNPIVYNKEHPVGKILDESSYLEPETFTASYGPIRLDDNEYFVLGDNRNNSSDSRTWGPLNKSFIIGRVFFRAYPFSKINTFPTPDY
jgi:signal peptidase I